jgi:transcriptional regulator with XRE-family HTH domain
MRALGDFIRVQRKLANLSLRELAEMANVSNAYLSQIERGLHEPSVRVLKAVAGALNLSADTLLAQAGVLESVSGGDEESGPAGGSRLVEAAILGDPQLSDGQKQALIGVYRSYVSQRTEDSGPPSG